VPIKSLEEALRYQTQINKFLVSNGIKELDEDYGEFIVQNAIGGKKQSAVNQGFDIRTKNTEESKLKQGSMS
jgi:hypothetical protein